MALTETLSHIVHCLMGGDENDEERPRTREEPLVFPELDPEKILLLVQNIEEAFENTLHPVLGHDYKIKQLPVFDGVELKRVMQDEPGTQTQVILEDFQRGEICVTGKDWKAFSAMLPTHLRSLLDTIWVRLFQYYDTTNQNVPLVCQTDPLKPPGGRAEVMASFCFPLRVIKQADEEIVYTLHIGFDYRIFMTLLGLGPLSIHGNQPSFPADFVEQTANRDDVLKVLESNFKWQGAKQLVFPIKLIHEMAVLALAHELGGS